MSLPEIVSHEEWRAARIALLAEEKALTRAHDAVSTKRRELPMVEVTSAYTFGRPDGEVGLFDLFEGRRQLIVDHAMWLDDRATVCPSCAARVDQVGHLAHLEARDTTYVVVSRGPVAELGAFVQRMGWRVPWCSSHGSRFNIDLGVTFDESVAPLEYNYRSRAELEALGVPIGEWRQPFDLHGMSVFLRVDERVFRTYSTYARGTDHLSFTSNFLDLTPLGRQEAWEEPKGRATALGAGAGDVGVRYHDEY